MNREFFTAFDKKKFLNLSDISSTTARGASFTGYSNSYTHYSGQLNDAAKVRLVALSSVEEARLPAGSFQYLARYRTIYPDESAVTMTSGELTSTATTEFNTNYKTGVVIEPTQQSVMSYVQWNAARNNIYDLMRDKQEELSYSLATKVEKFILQDTSYGLLSATKATDVVRGYQLVYGGDATSDAELANGDVLTVEMINKANTYLGSIIQRYTTYSGSVGTEAQSTVMKNAWDNEPMDPFVLIIGPEQKMALLNDSQFTSYNQYGGQEPLLTGEIGKVFDCKIVVSQYLPRLASAGTGWDGTTVTTNITRCFMMKGRAAYTFVWGQEPTFVLDKDISRTRDSMVLWTTYSGAVVHPDAIVALDVSIL
jgi:N4-gp56 family major capsid protein